MTAGKTLSEEERELLESYGLLDLMNEPDNHKDEDESSSQSSIDNHHARNNSAVKTNTHASNVWTRLYNIVKTPLPHADEQVKASYKTMQQANVPVTQQPTLFYNPPYDNTATQQSNNKILLGVGGTLFLLPHLAILLSLPPVLQRRGAPYLPTFKTKLNVMFDLIRMHINQAPTKRNLKFVDLGSGDGRVVFRAAREGLFSTSVGYEINPTLHLFAQARKLLTPKYWGQTTQFKCGDLWNIQLQNYDCVAVYGLAPIMDRLGAKMKNELKTGTLVVSNVFQIPG